MPLYEVEYSIPLNSVHKRSLAIAITKLHHERYGIPSFFVSVKFTDGSKNENFSGGELVSFLSYVPASAKSSWERGLFKKANL
jgi:hypothetical protein